MKCIFYSLNYKIYFSIRHSKHNAALFFSCDFDIAVICPIPTPSAYEVIFPAKWQSSYLCTMEKNSGASLKW